MEILGMTRYDEVVLLSVDKKSRNICIFHMIANWIQIFYIESMLNKYNNTLSLIVDFKKLKAIPLNTDSPPPCFYANYFDNFYKLEKGESRTKHPI